MSLVAPNTLYGERVNQLDLRFGKALTSGRTRTTLSVDLYNALNASSVLSQNNNFAAWQVPTAILPARFVKITMQFDF